MPAKICMCFILHAGPSCWAWWWQGAVFLPCMRFSDCQSLHKGRADVTGLFLLFPCAEQGVHGAAAPPSIACQHSQASGESGKLSTKKSALIQHTSSHKGLVPFHCFLLALLVAWCSYAVPYVWARSQRACITHCLWPCRIWKGCSCCVML